MQTQFLNTRINRGQGVLPVEASAVVFDCDGLLADTERLWLRAVVTCASLYGIELHDVGQFRGLAIDDAAAVLQARLSVLTVNPPSRPIVAQALGTDFGQLIANEACSMPGAVAMVRRLAMRLPVAVASNSPRDLLDEILRRIGLNDLIGSSVAQDEVAAPKPAPDLYLAAVEKLRLTNPGVSAHTAIAFEDSAVGSRAATSAGLFVVGINADPTLQLSCHDRYAALTDVALEIWADAVRIQEEDALAVTASAVGSYDPAEGRLTVRCRYPTGTTAEVRVYRQEQCRWNELPQNLPVAGADVRPGAAEVVLEVTGLSEGTYRYFLLTDSVLPEWNGRTGEFVIESRTTNPPLAASSHPAPHSGSAVDVMAWNLWFGGCHVNDGLAKQAAYLRAFPHDVVALQECFEVHGRRLGDALGWNIAQQGHDTGIISPYPLEVHETSTSPFATCATVHLPQGEMTVWSLHLSHSDYGPYTGRNQEIPAVFTLSSRGERVRANQLARILREQRRLERQGVLSGNVPVLIAGDFNAPSHQDWNDSRRGAVVEWPTTRMLELEGYKDSFRTIHPSVTSDPGHTWSPIISDDEEPQDRIDFVFVRGAKVLDAHAVAQGPGTGGFSDLTDGARRSVQVPHYMGEHLDNDWPTDHAAVVARIKLS